MKTLKSLLALTAIAMLASCNNYSDLPDGIYADIKIDKGPELLVKLDHQNTPMTVGNFVALAEGTMQDVDSAYAGKKYFDGLLFHRVIRDFMVQTGDPDGTGAGGPGYMFPNETRDDIKHTPGSIAMANAGAHTNGSQFYITEAETPWLDGGYTVFGCLVNPADVEKVKLVNQGDRIKEVVIVRQGEEAKNWDAYKAFKENKVRLEAEIGAKEAALKAAVDSMFAEADVLDSGVKILWIEKPKRSKPYAAGSTARVHYTGTLLDGKVFDSSVQRGKAFEFTVGAGQVIKGWDEAVAKMPIGSKAKVYLPSNMAYGEYGAGGVIPPSADLIFEIEILPQEKK